ncbi:Telomerase reverse transcriptase [Cladophialophora chaetospira]|uniref:Telomerase reverse transcriptase n=1 Tax=Cladophialophora chaetospira TaxID=386627 RepID=A0AA38WWI1_9EURO|nr:Telomerase reverse transcriptase [Cladophialophora chaetospira]
MAKKRKRAETTTSNRPTKKPKSTNHDSVRLQEAFLHHAVLSSFYPKVCTLRSYLLASLPATSRVRRRKLTLFQNDETASLLDTCLVGVLKQSSLSVKEARKLEFVTFTQTQYRATGANTGRSQQPCIDEIVDFVIWSLFKGDTTKGGRQNHVLCHGLQRGAVHGDGGRGLPTSLPGIVQRHPNDNLAALKAAPWSDILRLLGTDADFIFSSLLLDCGIFTSLEAGKDNYLQFSGIPISELPQLQNARSKPSRFRSVESHGLGSIRFMRHRMLYARPSLNTSGQVKFGLHHTHILQRVPKITQQRQAVQLLKYVFPRQFGLHSAFTSKVDQDERTQKLKDYTFREQEISGNRKASLTGAPRRLRGETIRLVQKLHRNHQACSYSQILRHYCPLVSLEQGSFMVPSNEIGSSVPSSESLVTQLLLSERIQLESDLPCSKYDGETSFLHHATPIARVSAFCRAAISHLLPADSFGRGLEGQKNRDKIMGTINDFLEMRRFESITMHQAVQGLEVSCISWLVKPGQLKKKMCQSDYAKRSEILHDFVYYIFDSLLIPIVRAHFYVTESSSQRHRLFYFRQDVWRKLSEPSLAALRLSIYAPIKPAEARHKLQSRGLGYSHLRLLPKDQGARPITNLKRKQLKAGAGKRVLGQSINTQLAPLFNVLNYERAREPSSLGSALFSVGDIHDRVADFRKRIPAGARLFFAKVDIKSCFDSIPQQQLLRMIECVFSEQSYRTTKHAELKSLEHASWTGEDGVKRKFAGVARPSDDKAVFSEMSISAIAAKKRHVIFTDQGQQKVWSRDSLLELLKGHIGDSMVKIGKRYMKQIDGIPQGSVLSILLCSYFYAMFERNELGFLHPQSCLLLRLIDDFLLVTTEDQLARRFLEVMAHGDGRYGIQVNPEKSLVNFDVAISGHRVPQMHGETGFPYCGMRINIQTLEFMKDRERKDGHVSNSLTVETSSRPGKLLRRKALSSLKIQMHAMLLDLSLNGREQVVSTLFGNFSESAMKMHQYLAVVAATRRPSQKLIRGVLEDLITAGWKICRAKNGGSRQAKHLTRTQMCWIAAAAFERVLGRKQSQYRDLLVWLRGLREASQFSMNMEPRSLEQLVKDNDRVFCRHVY